MSFVISGEKFGPFMYTFGWVVLFVLGWVVLFVLGFGVFLCGLLYEVWIVDSSSVCP